MENIDKIKERLRTYAKVRDWDQFHSPKNLSMALAVEASELMEHFQWLTERQSWQVEGEKRQQIIDEIADVQVYLLMLSDKLNVDIEDAVVQKIAKNEVKYPAARVRGSAKKYHEYSDPDQD